MAKIQINLDTTENRDDIVVLRAIAAAFDQTGYTDDASEAYRASAEAQIEDATPPKRARRPKTETAAEAQPVSQATAQESSQVLDVFGQDAPQSAPPAETSVTLVEINALLTELLGPKHGATADTLQGIVRANSEGTATSPKFADPKYWPGIYAALKELIDA